MPRRHTPPKHVPFTSNSACSKKRAFVSESAAKQAAELGMLRNMRLTLDTYQCHDCKQWHLTEVKHR
jgi:hypothetical protein